MSKSKEAAAEEEENLSLLMSKSKEAAAAAAAAEEENLEFNWGKKRGTGGKKKEVQFYESFTFDGDEYSLYDCVYLYKEGEPEPYIGKLVKIYEQPQGLQRKRKIKVLWFFRPVEILNYLGDNKTSEKEIFLASGDGRGLANINPLEAIAGKCSVICTSKDKRNPQPSEEELMMADFIFYRTFDVSKFTISDKIDDTIAGVEVKLLLNRKEAKKSNKISKLDTDRKEKGGEVVCRDKKLTPIPSLPEVSDKHGPSVPKEDADLKAPLIKQEPLLGENVVSHAGVESKETASTTVDELVLNDKSIAGVKAEFDEDEAKPGKASVSHNANKNNPKSGKNLGESDRPSKKARVGSSVKSSKELHPSISPPLTLEKDKNINIAPKRLRVDSDEDGVPASSKIGSASAKTKKSKIASDSRVQDKVPIKKLQSDEKTGKLSNGKVPKVAAQHPTEKNITTEGKIVEVSRRPDTDRSKWFKGLPWEDRMKTAHEQGTLVLLENLDPEYTATEIEDIIWHGFKENCTAKVVQRTAVSSPHSGQAFVIFKSRDAAEMAISKLDEGCLMLPNGRPLVASKGSLPELHGKPSSFPGHLQIDKLKHQLPREEIRRAVSTSHCSQPNTLEYEMAMEWCLLQARADSGWKELYKQHDEELRKLKARLKSK